MGLLRLRGGRGGSAGVLHSAQLDQISFPGVLDIEVPLLMMFFKIIMNNPRLLSSLEHKKLMSISLRKMIFGRLQAGSPTPITLVLTITLFGLLSGSIQLIQHQPQQILIDINLTQTCM